MTASGRQHVVRGSGLADSVEHPMPAEIMIEVSSGHAVEAFYPAFSLAVVGVEVLHMKRRPSQANALSEILTG